MLRPFRDYVGFEHVLGGAITFIHPVSGNVYATACEKKDSVHQDLVVYRMRYNGPNQFEEIKRYRGGIDAVAQFTMGTAMIDIHGALWVGLAATPLNDPHKTATGFQGLWDWIPNIDVPYGSGIAP